MPNLDQIWLETLQQLSRQSTKDTYSTVYQGTRLISANGKCTIEARSDLAKQWLENRLRSNVAAALASVLGKAVLPDDLEFILPPDTLPAPDQSDDEGDMVIDEDGDGFFVSYRAYYQRGYAKKFKSFVSDLYHALRSHANTANSKAWPYQETLADVTGMSKRKVVYCLQTLRKYHLVSVSKRTTKSGRSANVYTLRHPDKWRPLE